MMKLPGYKLIIVYVPEKFGSYNAKITIEKDKEVIEWLDESTLSKGEGKEWQLCPKCNGQGTVSKPPYIAGDVNKWLSSESLFECNVCNGKKIIQPPTPQPEGKEDEQYCVICGNTLIKGAYCSDKNCDGYVPQTSQPEGMSAEGMWGELHGKYFKECTMNDSMDGTKIRIDIAPHDLFEWFKKEFASLVKEKQDEIEYLRQILRESGTFFRDELTDEARNTFDSIDKALNKKP